MRYPVQIDFLSNGMTMEEGDTVITVVGFVEKKTPAYLHVTPFQVGPRQRHNGEVFRIKRRLVVSMSKLKQV